MIIYNHNSIRIVKNDDGSFSAGYAHIKQYPIKGLTDKIIKKHKDDEWEVNFPEDATLYTNYKEVLDDEGKIEKVIITDSDGKETGYLKTNKEGTYKRNNKSIVKATIHAGWYSPKNNYDEYTIGYVPEEDLQWFNPFSYGHLTSFGAIYERALLEFPDVDPNVVYWIVDLTYEHATREAYHTGYIYGDAGDTGRFN